MEIAHSAAIRVFCGEEENESEVMNGLKSLLHFDLETEKITVQKQTALGFSDKRISIFEVTLAKKRHVKAFLDSLLPRISGTDRQMLLRQLDLRVDSDANFFVRFEKEMLAKHNELLVTDSGNCYHVKIKMAAYPSSKETAIKLLRELIGENHKQYI
ncbi:hypothetical protein HYU40_01155 [Candidatus Woesearchaeota archaeon]|nr:hypothetical protein [Candidatus Woesearchaeota archaeon]